MTSAAPGILFLYLFDAVLLAIPVSLTLMWFYRRSIERAMLATATASETAEPPLATTRDVKSVNASTLAGWERRARLRLALVYGLAGVSASAFWTWLFFRAPGIQFTWIRAFLAWYSYCWPVPATLIAATLK